MNTMQRSAIDTANEVVSISFVCNKIGMDVPELDAVAGRSIKVHCPWSEFYHTDGGLSAAFRIYPASNSAYCFACSEYYSPVKLYAQATDTDPQSAAEALLDLVGHQAVDLGARWTAAISALPPAPSRDVLATALKTYCARIAPSWETQQFETPYAEWLGKCLDLLAYVHSAEDAAQWLEVSKRVMERELAT